MASIEVPFYLLCSFKFIQVWLLCALEWKQPLTVGLVSQFSWRPSERKVVCEDSSCNIRVLPGKPGRDPSN